MNSTFTGNVSDSNQNGWEYSTFILAVVFITSEVMPFLKKHKGNGISDTLVCLLRGSSCLTEKLANNIEQRQQPPAV